MSKQCLQAVLTSSAYKQCLQAERKQNRKQGHKHLHVRTYGRTNEELLTRDSCSYVCERARGGCKKSSKRGRKNGMSEQMPPHTLAAADQELAAVTDIVGQLVGQWRSSQPHFDGLGVDRLERLMRFMRSDVFPALGWTAAHIAVAICVELLASSQPVTPEKPL